mgnify:CR=1 FL=1
MEKFKLFEKINTKELLFKIIFTAIGGMILGFGIAFNAANTWGNDPISVFYDGISRFFNIEFGLASNIANYSLFIIVLICGRRYINIGTFIYTLPLGSFITLGLSLYKILNIPNSFIGHLISAILGCTMLFVGISFFIAANIGVDPWTGLALILKDKAQKEYKVFKVLIDVVALIIGWILGGKVGVTTVVAAFLGGPIIQKVASFLEEKVVSKFK